MARAPRYEVYVGPGIGRALRTTERAWRGLGLLLILAALVLLGGWALGGRGTGWLTAGLGAGVAGAVQLAFAQRRRPLS